MFATFKDWTLVTCEGLRHNAALVPLQNDQKVRPLSHLKFNPKNIGGWGLKNGIPSKYRTITLQCAKLSPRYFMTFIFQVYRKI